MEGPTSGSAAPPERADPRPLYVQVEELLGRRLASGRWRPGDLLPSEPLLAAELGVSPGTVRKALERLRARRLLERHQGKGTYVARLTAERELFHFFHLVDATGRRVEPTSRVLWRRVAPAGRRERERLGLACGARVVRIARLRALGRVEVISERLAVPEALFPGLAARRAAALPNALYALYEREWGVTIAEADERLRAVAAGGLDARLLGVAEGTPLLEVERLALGHRGRPVEWRVSRCDTRRFGYESRLR